MKHIKGLSGKDYKTITPARPGPAPITGPESTRIPP
jgi:hypothetical protein